MEPKRIGELIPTALNLAPVSNELTRLKTTDQDQRLAIALAEKPLRDLTEDDLKNVLRYVFALVGIRGKNLPVDEEKAFLHAYIFKFYGNHTPAEVRMAFDLAIQNRLEVEPTCYENFSVEYFARIMNAFRKWAAVEARRLETRTPPGPSAPDKQRIDAEYMDYRCQLAYDHQQTVNKLPTTLKRFTQWQKVNSRTK